jgi:hypothetical protein
MRIRLKEGESFALIAHELSMRVHFAYTDKDGNAHLKIKDVRQYKISEDGDEITITGTVPPDEEIPEDKKEPQKFPVMKVNA